MVHYFMHHKKLSSRRLCCNDAKVFLTLHAMIEVRGNVALCQLYPGLGTLLFLYHLATHELKGVQRCSELI